MLKERLMLARKNKSVTQAEVARQLNISRQAYNHYETGFREPPPDSIRILAEYFNVSTDYLLGNTDNPAPPQKNNHVSNFNQAVLTPLQLQLVSSISNLSDENIQKAIDYIELLKLKQN